METNKEQQPKHAQVPWYAVNYAGYINLQTTPNYEKSGNLLDSEHYNNAEANGERAVKCVNALEGIEDPEQWVDERKKEYEVLSDAIAEYKELEKYKTACEQINTDNPMAVAENLQEVIRSAFMLLVTSQDQEASEQHKSEIRAELQHVLSVIFEIQIDDPDWIMNIHKKINGITH